MSRKLIAIFVAAVLALSLGAAVYASGEASGSTSSTRGDLGPVEAPETAPAWIMSAFSTKTFTDEPIDDETVAEIVAAGINAPSAQNKQPWQFIIVQNDELKSSLVRGAAAVVIVAVPEEDYTGGGNSQFAAGCAAEAMYLYAQSIGLGAHMYTAPVAMTISADPAAYGVADGYEAAVVLGFGHYADYADAASAATVRSDYDTFVSVLE